MFDTGIILVTRTPGIIVRVTNHQCREAIRPLHKMEVENRKILLKYCNEY